MILTDTRAIHRAAILMIGVAFAFGDTAWCQTDAQNLDPSEATVVNSAMPVARAKGYVMRLEFAPGSATLYSSGRKRLQPLVEDWAGARRITIEVIGHTSTERVPKHSRRKFSNNYKLSTARAQVVAEHLAQELSVRSSKVVFSGRGSDEPIASNGARRGRAFNNRVTIRIATEQSSTLPPVMVGTTQHRSSYATVPSEVSAQLAAALSTVTVSGGTIRIASPARIDGTNNEMGDAVSFADGNVAPDSPVVLRSLAAYAGEVAHVFDTPDLNTEHADEISRLDSQRFERPLQKTGWSKTVKGNVGTAYSSNVFQSTTSEEASGILETAILGELTRDIASTDQLSIWAGATAAPHAVSTTPDQYTGRLGGAFRRRLSPTVAVSFLAEAALENDDVVNTEGEHVLRDFAHLYYRAQPSVRIMTRRNSSLWIAYAAQRMNFREQSILTSLDWWQHGPSVKLRSAIGSNGTIQVGYAFRARGYDEELASLRTGREFSQNPTERHFFNRLDVDTYVRTHPGIEWQLGSCLERKEDRFLGFESWTNYCVRSGVSADIGRRVSLATAVSYDRRWYDNRQSDDGDHLKYHRFTAQASVAYRISRSVNLHATAWGANRDTNRSEGLEYLDVGVFRMSTGASFSY